MLSGGIFSLIAFSKQDIMIPYIKVKDKNLIGLSKLDEIGSRKSKQRKKSKPKSIYKKVYNTKIRSNSRYKDYCTNCKKHYKTSGVICYCQICKFSTSCKKCFYTCKCNKKICSSCFCKECHIEVLNKYLINDLSKIIIIYSLAP